MVRTDEADLEHPNAMTNYSSRTESWRPMTETNSILGYVGLAFFCRYTRVIKPLLPMSLVASLDTVPVTCCVVVVQ